MIKQQSNDEQWNELWENCIIQHSNQYIDEKSRRTQKVIASVYDDNTVIGYSGGKDSLVLRDICEKSLNRPCFITCFHENEFPSFIEWMQDTKPGNCAFVHDTSLSLDFLNSHLSYLFPHEKKERNAYVSVWQRPTYRWMQEHGKCKIMTGKRKDDGNFCGNENQYGCRQTIRKSPHIISLNPLSDWTHSELLAYIRYNKIQLPEIYYYPNGFRFGTHPWTERRRLNLSYYDTFDEIMSIDKDVLKHASNRLDILKKYFHYLIFGGEKL